MPERDMHVLVENAIRLGCAVIPIRPDKRPAIPSWKEFQLSCPSEAQVRLWLQDRPSAMAIVTGTVSRMVVLDFDGEKGIATMQALGITPHVQTGSGGFHAYFVHPDWYVPTVNSKAKRELGERYPGLDIRADGGYAIFAGRSHSGEYRWLRDMVPDALEVLPDDVRDALGLLHPTPPPQQASGVTQTTDPRNLWAERLLDIALSRVSMDGRNNTGFWAACQLRDNGYTAEEAQYVLSEYAARVSVVNTKGAPEAYTLDEARNSVRQAYSRAPRQPWDARLRRERDEQPRDGLPTIEVSNRELRDVTTEVLATLRAHNNPPQLYVRSGQMVYAVPDEKGRYGNGPAPATSKKPASRRRVSWQCRRGGARFSRFMRIVWSCSICPESAKRRRGTASTTPRASRSIRPVVSTSPIRTAFGDIPSPVSPTPHS